MSRHSQFGILVLFLLSGILAACESTTVTPESFPTYDPFVPINGTAPALPGDGGSLPDVPTRTPGPTPTRAPFSVTLPTPRDPNAEPIPPTPNSPRTLPTPRTDADQYMVQTGDTLGSIAARYGVSAEALMQVNNLADPNMLSEGQTLLIPAPEPGAVGPSFKIIPDSELVNGPAAALFDIDSFIQGAGGHLAGYTQDVNGETLTGAQIVQLAAANYSVNPRLLLALLEYRSEWISSPTPAETDYPLGFRDANHTGLYRQLTWAANELNRGYYLWRANAVGAWVLGDGTVVPVDPTINAGTAGVQQFLSKLNDRQTWEKDVSPFGVFQTYYFMFGNPFDRAVEPLVPAGLNQPRLQLPFDKGITWAFTGGPHGGWDNGSAWAALDFGPILDAAGCTPSSDWVAAAAGGYGDQCGCCL